MPHRRQASASAVFFCAVCAGGAFAQGFVVPAIPPDQNQVGLEILKRRMDEMRGGPLTSQPAPPPPQAGFPQRNPWSLLRVGMTEVEVNSLLGSPDRVEAATPAARWHWDKGGARGGWVDFDPRSQTVTEWRSY